MFFFIVTPDENEDDDIVNWEGSIRQMSKLTEKRIGALEKKMDKKFDQ